MDTQNYGTVADTSSLTAAHGPVGLKKVRLELARSDKYPAGSFRHGYEFIAPLDANRHIDLQKWKALRQHCRVRRFWADEEDQVGRLTHKPGGEEHAFWAFDYNPDSTDDDEPGFRFGAHAFVPGEYVTIRGHDGEQHTFRVISADTAR